MGLLEVGILGAGDCPGTRESKQLKGMVSVHMQCRTKYRGWRHTSTYGETD